MNLGNDTKFLIRSTKFFERWMMSPQHVDPEEAVKIHEDVKSNKSFAIHWGTFALANEVSEFWSGVFF